MPTTRTEYRWGGTVSGRMSSSQPNMPDEDDALAEIARQQITEQLLKACREAGYSRVRILPSSVVEADFTGPEPVGPRENWPGHDDPALYGIIERIVGPIANGAKIHNGHRAQSTARHILLQTHEGRPHKEPAR